MKTEQVDETRTTNVSNMKLCILLHMTMNLSYHFRNKYLKITWNTEQLQNFFFSLNETKSMHFFIWLPFNKQFLHSLGLVCANFWTFALHYNNNVTDAWEESADWKSEGVKVFSDVNGEWNLSPLSHFHPARDGGLNIRHRGLLFILVEQTDYAVR